MEFNETYQLTDNNYYSKKFKKTQIVIGNTYRSGMLHYGSWVNRWNGSYKKTSTFTIDKDGVIFNHFNPEYYSDFIGVEQDKSNISISLVNEGWLRKDSLNNKFIDWLGNIFTGTTDDILEKKWRNQTFWVKYTDKQVDSTKNLLKYLTEKYNIRDKSIGSNVFSESVDIYQGITYRSNYSQEFTDVNPHFPVQLI